MLVGVIPEDQLDVLDQVRGKIECHLRLLAVSHHGSAKQTSSHKEMWLWSIQPATERWIKQTKRRWIHLTLLRSQCQDTEELEGISLAPLAWWVVVWPFLMIWFLSRCRSSRLSSSEEGSQPGPSGCYPSLQFLRTSPRLSSWTWHGVCWSKFNFLSIWKNCFNFGVRHNIWEHALPEFFNWRSWNLRNVAVRWIIHPIINTVLWLWKK